MVNNKPKILFVQEVFGTFSEVFLYRINTSLNKFDVSVMAGVYVNQESFPYDQEKLYIWDYKDVHPIEKVIPFINRKLKTKGRRSGIHNLIISQINKSDADLVCFQLAFLPVDMGKEIRRINKKICLIQHGTDVNKAVEDKEYRSRLIDVWHSVDRVIFVSHFLKNVALSLGCPESKAIVNYLGVSDVSGKYKKTIDDDIFRFIVVARMIPVKNHISLVHAFSQLLKQTEKKVELIMIGEGELEEQTKDEVLALGLKDHVKVLGGLANEKVLSKIANSDACILISKIYVIKDFLRQEEAFGLVLLEAARFGLPLIGSKTGGIPEIIIDGETGYLVDPLDIDDICQAMLKIVEDPNKGEQMGKNAKELVEKKFCFETQMKKLENIFLDI